MEIGSGNLLLADVDALVNTVNTVGVMGKGIALQFKRAYPANYRAYRAACERGEVRLGSVFVFDMALKGSRRWIVNFPTKQHWRSSSRLEDIETGLDDLVRVVHELSIRSIAIPALGCGNGGLDWRQVRPLIERASERMPGVRVVVFPPEGAPDPAAMPVATPVPPMTRRRALLITAITRYLHRAQLLEVRDGVSELEIHKLGYLLQRYGSPSGYRFNRGRYGPYSEDLTHDLAEVEGHFLRGLGDRTARVTELAPVNPLPKAVSQADDALARHPDDQVVLQRLLDLVDGFETPYGVELLATVDFAAQQRPATSEAEELGRRVAEWNMRKQRLFTPAHVRLAADRLVDHGLLPAQSALTPSS